MEKKVNLKEWSDKVIDEAMKKAGFTPLTTPMEKNKQGVTPVSGTITFLKGESAKRAKEYYQKKKGG